MANSRDKVIVLDGPRNAVVRLNGVLDSANESWPQAIVLSDFTNNDTKVVGLLVGLRLDWAEFSVGDPMGLLLAWHSNSPDPIDNFTQSGEKNYRRIAGLQPDRTKSGYDGSIDVSTIGFTPGNPRTYDVTLHFIKLYA